MTEAATQLRPHRCPVATCERYVRGHLAFCNVHWAMMPRAHKLAVTTALRAAGGDPKAASCADPTRLAAEAISVLKATPVLQARLPGVVPIFRSRTVPIEELEAASLRFGSAAPTTAAEVEARRRRRLCDEFNQTNPIGARVKTVTGHVVTTTTEGIVTAPAQVLPTGEPSVWIDRVRWPLTQVKGGSDEQKQD